MSERNSTDDGRIDGDWKRQEWMTESGPVAARTNVVIAGVLDWADKTDTNVVTKRNVEDAVKDLTPVGGTDTVAEYVERVTRYGPFDSRGIGTWKIQWGANANADANDAKDSDDERERTSTGEPNE